MFRKQVRATTFTMAMPIVCFLACMANGQDPNREAMNVQGESLVLAKTETGNLCFQQVKKGSLTLRNTFVAGAQGGFVYIEGRDYVVDYDKGTISRTTDSHIPDYSDHCTYGLKGFEHGKFPNISNHRWFVWADYETTNGKPWSKPHDQRKYLTGTRKKLETGGPFRIATYGDSITAGGEASEPDFRFSQRFANYLQARFPTAKVELQDASIPGYTSREGIKWFDEKLGTVEKPDLVLVGFGMNDHNQLDVGGTEPAQFKDNLVAIIKLIREQSDAEVILFSAFPPNDNWRYGTHRMDQFAKATQHAAADARCAYADVYGTWEMALQRKDQSSLLNNNINHPNDFGHWLYEQAFEAIKF